MKKKERKNTLRFLIAIPVVIVLDIMGLFAGIYFDTNVMQPSPDQLGHPFPVFTLLAILFMMGITIIVLISTIIRLIQYFIRKKKEKDITANKE